VINPVGSTHASGYRFRPLLQVSLPRNGPRIIGRYELHSELAVGGMASVYLGRAVDNPKPVAIKRLHEHLGRDPELATMLLEEARITKHIVHPNVVKTLDVVRDDRQVLLVMEYVHGETVASLLRAASALEQQCPPEIAAAIVHGVLLGLDAAHETCDGAGARLGVVHRDVSPQNIIVGTDGIPRLLDFGIATAIGTEGHARAGEVEGKIPYMAPEVLQFEPATQLADLWGAAVVFWELLCGRRLFRGDSDIHVWGQVINAPIPNVSEIRGRSTPLDRVLDRALCRKKEERYPTAAMMTAEIEASIALARPAEVSAWVERLAASALAERQRVFANFEAATQRP
jgi:eukaryotic-like serine/threonine-protein kinase